VPFLRVIRDKRGYETTYLMHWYREGTRQRSKVLYVFRTPGGVRVGRDPLDAEARQEIEGEHPDIAFEWDAVRETKQVIEAAPERRRRPRPAEPAAPASAADATAPADRSAPPPWPVPPAVAGSTAEERVAFLAAWYPVARAEIEQRTPDPARREALLGLAERLNPAAWTDADQIASGVEQASDALERLTHVFARRRRRRRPGRPGPHAATDAAPAGTQ
jgi:hypothetical protein